MRNFLSNHRRFLEITALIGLLSGLTLYTFPSLIATAGGLSIAGFHPFSFLMNMSQSLAAVTFSGLAFAATSIGGLFADLGAGLFHRFRQHQRQAPVARGELDSEILNATKNNNDNLQASYVQMHNRIQQQVAQTAQNMPINTENVIQNTAARRGLGVELRKQNTVEYESLSPTSKFNGQLFTRLQGDPKNRDQSPNFEKEANIALNH